MHASGRGAVSRRPAALRDSVVSADGRRCWQLMECDDRALLDEWMRSWSDLVEFEVVPVIASAERQGRDAA